MEGRNKKCRIPDEKVKEMRSKFFSGCYNAKQVQLDLGLNRTTFRRYEKEFEIIKHHYPEQAANDQFYPPKSVIKIKKYVRRLPYKTIAALRVMYFNDTLDKRAASKLFNISYYTVCFYANEFAKIKASYPERISDKHFFAPKDKAEHKQTEIYIQMTTAIPSLLKQIEGKQLCAMTVFPLYRAMFPDGYALSTFMHHFALWCDMNQISRQRLYILPEEDIVVLNSWRMGDDHHLWQIAVSLLWGSERKPIKAVSEKVEVCIATLQGWYRAYQRSGLDVFKKKIRQTNEKKVNEMKQREDNIIHLLHQLPKIFGINRTSWKQSDLADVYFKEYGVKITRTDVSRDLRRRGYRASKAREVLTSPDPLFREKYELIQNVLKNLGPKEKFFSIDEYGPFSLKIKGGRAFTKKGDFKTYPQRQKSKGWLICTAALELSTNQVTHFYSPKKNTAEMVKLVDILVKQYHDEEKIYLSWDKAAWHISKELIEYIDVLNSDEYHEFQHIPYIGLAPLPAAAQFLNVIESVFSGLARSVIHHSNYQNVEECQTAIDTYFKDRNAHFISHPHRAGNKIWGKELVPPHFDKAHRCKTTNSLSTRS